MQDTPYHSEIIDRKLAQVFERRELKTAESPHAIRRISIVGGLPDMAGENLLADDVETLYETAVTLSGAGIDISATPHLLIYNLLPPVECSFTALADAPGILDAHRTDLVIASAIPRAGVDRSRISHMFGYRYLEGNVYRDPKTYGQERLAGVEPNHTMKGIWANAAFNTGAPIVVTRGGLAEELSINHFTDTSKFRSVIGSHEGPLLREFQARVGRNSHIGGRLGLAVLPDYPQHIRQSINPDSQFGRRLLELIN